MYLAIMTYGAEVDKEGRNSRSLRVEVNLFIGSECQICTKDHIPSEKIHAQRRGFHSRCDYFNACVLLLGAKRMCICRGKDIFELEFDIGLLILGTWLCSHGEIILLELDTSI